VPLLVADWQGLSELSVDLSSDGVRLLDDAGRCLRILRGYSFSLALDDRHEIHSGTAVTEYGAEA
jgi:hypothetical protein